MGRRGAVIVVGSAVLAAAMLAPPGGRAQSGRELRAPADFAGIADPAARSAALFTAAGTVLQHPRCLNCHPDGDQPTQRTGMPHIPPVERGPDGFGGPALRCIGCHPAANFEPANVPGHPKWRLAPLSMAWQRRSLGEICAQLKDPARNGGHGLEEIVEHMAHDDLVGWAWRPGGLREPAPGTQAAFGALVKAWADTGAVCPTP